MKQTTITWSQVFERLAALDVRGKLVWGVPRGGAILVGLLCGVRKDFTVAIDPGEADLILDDLIDSGATRDRYAHLYPNAEFIGLFPKDGWLVFPWEHPDPAVDNADHVRRLIELTGEDPNREGLQDTPKRVIKALREMTAGYYDDPAAILSRRFNEPCDEMVLVKGIPFNSLCEHHLLPFSGVAHVAYIPDKQVVGLSKLPRLVQCHARRLQLQERLTQAIANDIQKHLEPLGVAVVLEAHHSCMSLRGVRSAGTMTTSALLGAFRDGEPRQEFLSLIARGQP